MKFKFVLWKYRKDETGKHIEGNLPIYLRIFHGGKNRYLPTGINVTLKDWNEKKEAVRKSNPNYLTHNGTLERIKRDAINKALELREKGFISADAIKRALRDGGDTKEFFQYAYKILDTVKARGQFWHWKNLNTTINKFVEFTRQRTIYFTDITPETLENFETFLRAAGNNNTTINKRMKLLKRIFKIAIRHDVIKHDQNPFQKYDLPPAKSYKDNKLSVEEIYKLRDLDLPMNSPLWHNKNIFLFAFHTSGIRFGDICRLKWKNVIDGRLKYISSKTKLQMNHKLHPPALEILKHYKSDNPEDFIFPLLDSRKDYSDDSYLQKQISSKNAKVNSLLKDVCKLAKITPISFHASRHSFAHYSVKSKTSLPAISMELGHADLKTTQIYLRHLDNSITDEEMDTQWKNWK